MSEFDNLFTNENSNTNNNSNIVNDENGIKNEDNIIAPVVNSENNENIKTATTSVSETHSLETEISKSEGSKNNASEIETSDNEISNTETYNSETSNNETYNNEISNIKTSEISNISDNYENAISYVSNKYTDNNTSTKYEYGDYKIPEISVDYKESEVVKKPGIFSKIAKTAGMAALFGIVASGTFLGINHLYNSKYPNQQNANTNVDNISNDILMLDKPTDIVLQTSTVIPGNNVSQPDVPAVIEQVKPSTVSIVGKFVTTSYFFGQPFTQEDEGSGSGIIIGENDESYLIATNNHVVQNSTELKVTFIDGSEHLAYIKGTDASNDLAVIAVNKEDLSEDTVSSIKVAKLGDSDSTKEGEMVIAIGNALGYGQSSTVGYISAKDREITTTNSSTGVTTTLKVLQTDAAINPGNSGGALVNMNGEVIGINAAKLSATSVEGIGYAIPISYAIPIVNDLMTRETFSDADKGYLGIYMEDVTETISEQWGWPIGVYVSSVADNGPAKEAGILAGDIITAVNGVNCTNRVDLKNKVTSYKYGTTISITIQRLENSEFKEYTIDVVLAKADDINSSTSSSDNNNIKLPSPSDRR